VDEAIKGLGKSGCYGFILIDCWKKLRETRTNLSEFLSHRDGHISSKAA